MMWNVAQEVYKREIYVEMNEFKSWKLAKIGLKMRALEATHLNKLEFFKCFPKNNI